MTFSWCFMKCHLSDAWICSTSGQTPHCGGRSLLCTSDLLLALGSPEGIGSGKNAETGSAPTGSQCCCPNICSSWAWRMREPTSSRTEGTVLSSEHRGISKDRLWSALGTLLTLIFRDPLLSAPGLGVLPFGSDPAVVVVAKVLPHLYPTALGVHSHLPGPTSTPSISPALPAALLPSVSLGRAVTRAQLCSQGKKTPTTQRFTIFFSF